MNKCLVRKLLEAGQRILKSISRPPPPSSNFFFVSGHFKNFLNTIYFTPWPTPQGGRGQRFLVKFITGHFKSFFKRFFLPPPSSHIETQWWRAWMWTKPSIFVNWPWTALSKCPLRWLFQKQKYFDEKPLRTPLFFLFMEGGRPPHRPPSFYGQSCQYNYFSLWILPLGISPWPKDCQFWKGQNCHTKTI